MLTTLYVVRHAHRMSHGTFRALSDVVRDPPLTARGEEQLGPLAHFFAEMPANEQPQLLVCSPYTRCLRTAMPIAEALPHVPLVVEPGLAEWFAPVWPESSGRHPSPRAAEHVAPLFPRVDTRWTPLLYPDPMGESLPQVHARMKELSRRIAERCKAWQVERVACITHAAPAIALGRMLQTNGTFEDVAHLEVRAATASVSKYVKEGDVWRIVYNGATDFLPNGEERAWDFSFVPSNNTEPGMGPEWHDPYEPHDASLLYRAKL
ncbi:hypothetical protein MNAN1_002323 [Malassezia nana]|uniref:Uncharacterized protein n=1 Tax=Malassezia nana TaxID=180528 RepID=A0AAF0EJ50_9BASI|nr:hypothetical protein MNAN1_002323 [Malassezia nana]